MALIANKNIISLLVFLSLLSCDDTRENPYAPEKILEVVKDKEGRILRKVTTGYIAGEDFYLTIETFDFSGNVTKVYGIKPYGHLFATEYQYDTAHRVIKKIDYDLSTNEYKNYNGESYSLKDTLANFESHTISEEVRIHYDDAKNRLYKTVIRLSSDSITGKEKYDTSGSAESI